MWSFKSDKATLPTADRMLAGRTARVRVPERHFVNGAKLAGPYADGLERIVFGLGCFWGAERLFWQLPGVVVTAVGYAGGGTPNPSYEEVCSGRTGHSEVVLVVFDPNIIGLDRLLQVFWENHDPTQGMRQGNDVGTQYRSVIYTSSAAQLAVVGQSRDLYQQKLQAVGLGPITTEIREAPEFYFAEDYHQQYLAKNPNGYCGLAGTGVSCPIGLAVA